MQPGKAAAVCARRCFGVVAEKFFKEVGVRIPQLQRDAADGPVGGLQEQLGAVQALNNDFLPEAAENCLARGSGAPRRRGGEPFPGLRGSAHGYQARCFDRKRFTPPIGRRRRRPACCATSLIMRLPIAAPTICRFGS